jgi:hypothetical protein
MRRKFFGTFETFMVFQAYSSRESKMAELDGQESELRNDLMRFRAMEAEATDPIALHFLRDIVVDLEAELDRRYHQTR